MGSDTLTAARSLTSPARISPIAHDFYNHVDFGAFRNEAIVMPPLFYHCPTNVYSMADRNRAFGGPTGEGDHNAKPTKCMILTCLYGLQGHAVTNASRVSSAKRW